MSDLLAELRSKWDEAIASGAGGREWRAVALSQLSPVKLLAGIRDRDGRISVLVETAVRHAPKHRVRFQAEGISPSACRLTRRSILVCGAAKGLRGARPRTRLQWSLGGAPPHPNERPNKKVSSPRGRAPHFIQTHAGILAKSWTRGPVSYANLLISLARPRGIEPLFSP